MIMLKGVFICRVASDWNSEDPGSNPGWISMSFFASDMIVALKIIFKMLTVVNLKGDPLLEQQQPYYCQPTQSST